LAIIASNSFGDGRHRFESDCPELGGDGRHLHDFVGMGVQSKAVKA
jgi:hypothetical protein